jgi:hypothetical protein
MVSSARAERDQGSRSAVRRDLLRAPQAPLSPVFEARENDVSGNRHPKGIVADERYLDEDPDDCKPRENKRQDEYKIDSQCLAP